MAVDSPVSLLALLALLTLLALLALLAVLPKALLATILGIIPLAAAVVLLLLLLLLILRVAAAAAKSLAWLEGLGCRLERCGAGPEASADVHLLLGLARQVLILGSRVILPGILHVIRHVFKAPGCSGE